MDSFRYYNGFFRNFPTKLEIFSLYGYEISMSENHIQNTAFLGTDTFNFSKMTGLGVAKIFNDNCQNNSEEVEKQLIANAVKYLIVEKDRGNEDSWFSQLPGWNSLEKDEEKSTHFVWDDEGFDSINWTNEIENSLNKMNNIRIESVRSLNDQFDLITLDSVGINGLVTDGKEDYPIRSHRMDLLSFDAYGSDQYILAFSYDDNINAYLVDENGKKKELETKDNIDGNLLVLNSSSCIGEIFIEYKNIMHTIAFGSEILLVILFIFGFIKLHKKGAEA